MDLFAKHRIRGCGLHLLGRTMLREICIDAMGDQIAVLSELEELREEQVKQVPSQLPQTRAAGDDSGHDMDMHGPLSHLQKELLRTLDKNPWWLDPNRNPRAEEEWSHPARSQRPLTGIRPPSTRPVAANIGEPPLESMSSKTKNKKKQAAIEKKDGELLIAPCRRPESRAQYAITLDGEDETKKKKKKRKKEKR